MRGEKDNQRTPKSVRFRTPTPFLGKFSAQFPITRHNLPNPYDLPSARDAGSNAQSPNFDTKILMPKVIFITLAPNV